MSDIGFDRDYFVARGTWQEKINIEIAQLKTRMKWYFYISLSLLLPYSAIGILFQSLDTFLILTGLTALFVSVKELVYFVQLKYKENILDTYNKKMIK
jgi:hypothetical protein